MNSGELDYTPIMSSIVLELSSILKVLPRVLEAVLTEASERLDVSSSCQASSFPAIPYKAYLSGVLYQTFSKLPF